MRVKEFKPALLIAMVAVTSFSACKKDEPLPEVEENELITTVALKFTNTANTADVKTYAWKDLDGQGGNAPVIENIVLAANTTYTIEVETLLNETATPAEDIKEEVEEESADHLFVYKPTGNLSVTITDTDANGLPIGLKALGVTTGAGTGTLQLILRHQPDGAKDGTEAPGSTDADATFGLTIQ